jgi:hypothetical protein
VIEIGSPVIADVASRLDAHIAHGERLCEASRSVRSQRAYERWRDDVARWRAAMAVTLEAGFVTPAARNALLAIWTSNTPLCTIWPEWVAAERDALSSALDLAERIREATAAGPQIT